LLRETCSVIISTRSYSQAQWTCIPDHSIGVWNLSRTKTSLTQMMPYLWKPYGSNNSKTAITLWVRNSPRCTTERPRWVTWVSVRNQSLAIAPSSHLHYSATDSPWKEFSTNFACSKSLQLTESKTNLSYLKPKKNTWNYDPQKILKKATSKTILLNRTSSLKCTLKVGTITQTHPFRSAMAFKSPSCFTILSITTTYSTMLLWEGTME
jgi:hypothetical protein